ncbi:MAG: hypothetical protein BWY09_01329 [Candidatus Hydrogenedentes bacterium ADurb.Bin179]|nr:MAG: hypothetical protein BWY09_01329 [Candidatus Hydrogenedentes bacterium ADurb.Bin179]
MQGSLKSKTALRLVREWIDIHELELMENWERARTGSPLNTISPLD